MGLFGGKKNTEQPVEQKKSEPERKISENLSEIRSPPAPETVAKVERTVQRPSSELSETQKAENLVHEYVKTAKILHNATEDAAEALNFLRNSAYTAILACPKPAKMAEMLLKMDRLITAVHQTSPKALGRAMEQAGFSVEDAEEMEAFIASLSKEADKL